MHLYMSQSHPANTTLLSAAGEALYRITTPGKFLLGGGTTTITRLSRNTNEAAASSFANLDTDTVISDSYSPSGSQEVLNPRDTHNSADQDVEIAQIERHRLSNSRLRYNGGPDVDMNTFLKRQDLIRFHYEFSGPDGRSYLWNLGILYPFLILNDGSSTLVARFYRRRRIFGSGGDVTNAPDPNLASLEIFPVGEHMVDLIVVTFAYIERTRRDRSPLFTWFIGG